MRRRCRTIRWSACFADFFSQPAPFRADAKVDVEPVSDAMNAMLDCHVSQVYEWIPHTLGRDGEVPSDPAQRRAWLPEFYGRARAVARRFAPEYRLAEAFEISEYARKPKPEELPLLFPERMTSTSTVDGDGGPGRASILAPVWPSLAGWPPHRSPAPSTFERNFVRRRHPARGADAE